VIEGTDPGVHAVAIGNRDGAELLVEG